LIIEIAASAAPYGASSLAMTSSQYAEDCRAAAPWGQARNDTDSKVAGKAKAENSVILMEF
jgi:hypothetical protein